jgi:hypothetical protein
VGSEDSGGGRRAELDDIARSLSGEDTHAFYMSARSWVRPPLFLYILLQVIKILACSFSQHISYHHSVHTRAVP